MSNIRIISSMATRHLLTDLIHQFKGQNSCEISLESVGGVVAAQRIEQGEKFDVVILASNAIDSLIKKGAVVTGTRTDIVSSGMAIAVSSQHIGIDVSGADLVKQAVLNAKTIGYSTGPSGTYLLKLFEEWGIASQLEYRLIKAAPGIPVGDMIASGQVEIGFQQLSELITCDGINILGALPEEIQLNTLFSVGIPSTAKLTTDLMEFIAYLNSAESYLLKSKHGMTPVPQAG
ncbi:MAG: substrate-binding domain-containing protein [Vibrio sp.]|uniref:substrate-binding domain-containing protein n=1 Tax=Vibrio sp. TaxID=678 RepID=UPI003A86B697